MARDLPGFYYDEAKQKYFRIQPGHVLPSSSTFHTRRSVRVAEDDRRNRDRLSKRQRRMAMQRVNRSPWTNTDTYKLLSHRLGSDKQPYQLTIAQTYASGLSRKTAILTEPLEQKRLEPPSVLDYAPTIHVAPEGRLMFGRGQYTYVAHPLAEWYPNLYAYSESVNTRLDTINLLPITIMRSIDYRGIMHVLMTTADNPNVHMTRFGVRRNHHGQSVIFPDQAAQGFRAKSVEATTNDGSLIWDLACADDSPTYAVAASSGLFTGGIDNERYDEGLTPVEKLRGREQVSAIFKDEQIIMSGERGGRVNFTDCRSRDTVARLLHSSAVLDTCPTGRPEQILVHGFSSLSLYDLRWIQNPVDHTATVSRPQDHTQPYLKFAVPSDRHSDVYTYGRKLGYSFEMDMVVASSIDTRLPGGSARNRRSRNRVSLYSATTGKLLPGPLTDHDFEDQVDHVAIGHVRDGPQSIVLTSGSGIWEWTMHGDEEDYDARTVKAS